MLTRKMDMEKIAELMAQLFIMSLEEKAKRRRKKIIRTNKRKDYEKKYHKSR